MEDAGVSGDTSASGFARLDWATASNPRITPIELGSNDALREEYGTALNSIFPRLANKHDVVFYAFALEGVAASAKPDQADGFHPRPAGATVMAEHMLSLIIPMVKAAEARTP